VWAGRLRLSSPDEIVIEATGKCMAVSRVLWPFVTHVVIANPPQVKAIAHAHVKTDKVERQRKPCVFPQRAWAASTVNAPSSKRAGS
jgi:hypothetical protein